MKTLYNLSDCLGDDDDGDRDDAAADDRADDGGADATAGVVAVGIKHATMMLLSAVCVSIPSIVGDIAVTPATDTTGTLYLC